MFYSLIFWQIGVLYIKKKKNKNNQLFKKYIHTSFTILV